LDHAPKTAPDAAMQAVGLLVQSRLEADISRYSPEVELIVLPAPNPRGVQPTSFEHSAHLIVNGRNAARDPLKNREGSRRLRLAG
jgi:hypothetical protein